VVVANAFRAVSVPIFLFLVQGVLVQGASAEPQSGAYLDLKGSVTWLQDANNSGQPFLLGSPDTKIESSYDLGYSVSAAVGYAFASRILKERVGPLYARTELEIAWRENSLDELKIKEDGGLGDLLGVGSLNGLSASASGKVQSFSGLYNVWIDVDAPGPVTPYFGGGIGVGFVWADNVKVGNVQIVDDWDAVFAYQIGAGAGLEITEWLTLTLDYRWSATTDPEFETEWGSDFDSAYETHNVGIGLRYFF
jgi:opacity protein-like surface antigen